MTISVVIPAYNEEKYLPRTLASLKKLRRQPDEVVVIDGSSTDKTAATARKLGAKVVIVPKKTIGFARQKGVEAATGSVIAFTDSDTVVPPDWLNKIEETLAQPGVAAVYSGFRVPDGWWVYRYYVNWIQPVTTLFFHFIGLPMAPGQNTAFWKAKAQEAGGYPENFKIAEDLEMARRIRRVGKLVYRPDNFVTSSGRRGDEGWPLLIRIFKVFFYYFITRRADKIGFPDIR
ncbi:MAG: glycosyltransferase family 2 protein [Patescibacteria group bacterium]